LNNSGTSKKKISELLIEKKLVSDLDLAQALILEGKVKVNGKIINKTGMMIKIFPEPQIEIIDKIPYVSRGGLKLEKAVEEFKLEIEGKLAIDIGASTGGFTDFLIKEGIKAVICIDVGYGQLSWKLRNSPKVTVYERTNVRYLDVKNLPFLADITVVDVSFISVRTIFDKILEVTNKNGVMLILVKPQFEIKKEEVTKGGIVKNKNLHIKVLSEIIEYTGNFNVEITGLTFSKIKGAKGNLEFWLYLKKNSGKSAVNNKKTELNYDKMIENTVEKSYDYFKISD
jgi:23S rRNA (cytidine1920-2'-O)/16S rRNA (cytidine1409-2'-O)-methyltransferase